MLIGQKIISIIHMSMSISIHLAFTTLVVMSSSSRLQLTRGFYIHSATVQDVVRRSSQSSRRCLSGSRGSGIGSGVPSSTKIDAVKGDSKKSAWSRGVPMAERSMARVKVDSMNIAKNTRSYEKARPNFLSNRKSRWQKYKPVAGKPMPNPTGKYLETLAKKAQEIRKDGNDAKPTRRHPLFKFNSDVADDKKFIPPSLSEIYASVDINSSHCSKTEYEEYYKVLSEILTKGKNSGKITGEELRCAAQWLYRSEPLVETKLPLLESNSFDLDLNQKDVANQFQQNIEEQREKFMKETSMSEHQYELIAYVLIMFGHYCSKFRNSDAIRLAWHKVKEAGLNLNEKNCNAYLYILTSIPNSNGTLSMSGSVLADLLGEPKSTEIKSRPDLSCEVAKFHDLLYKPTDRSTKLRVSALVAAGDPVGAEAILDKFSPEGDSVKLRTYLPILKSYCDSCLCDKAFNLFVKMLKSPQALLEAENYVLVLSSLAENGYFRANGKDLSFENIKSQGFTATSGSKLFDEIVVCMANDVLEITSASAKRIYNAFAKSSSDLMETGTATIDPMSMLQPNISLARNDELIVSRSTVDATSAYCPRSAVTLRLLTLNKPQKERLHDGLLEVAKEAFMEFNKKRKVTKKDSKRAAEGLNDFSDWMNQRKGRPFTAVIDGANTAYFGQNFHEGKFNFYQIEFLVKALESMNEHALVIMPAKYMQKTFHVNLGGFKQQTVTEQEVSVLRRLQKQDQLYAVPSGLLDDYYWMLASISSQNNASNGKSLDVTPEQAESENRFPGTRPMVLSNDLMRDHRLELFDPRLFRRWTASHIVNYNFTAFVNDECVDPEVSFSTPDFFSHEIQGNTSIDEGMTWHFPVSDWDKNERLVVRLPSNCRVNPSS